MRLITSTFALRATLVLGAGIVLAGCHSKVPYGAGQNINEPAGAQPGAAPQWQRAVQDPGTQPSAYAESGWQPGMYYTVPGTSANPPSHQAAPVISEPSGAQAPAPQPAPAAQPAKPTAGNEVVIPLHQEVLNVGKRNVDSGQVTIKKEVITQTVNQPVQLRQETVVVTREPAGSQQAPAGPGTSMGKPFEQSTITIPLQKEEAVVQKGSIISGEVVARKETGVQQTNIQGQVKQETVQVQESPNTQNVKVEGNLNVPQQSVNEGAGAQAPAAPAPKQ